MVGNTNTELLVAGGFAAFSVDLLIYPLDTLKTRYQSRDYKRLYYDPATNAINRAKFFRGLYQGVGSIILVTIPSSGLFFTTYEALRSLFKKVNPTLTGASSPLVPQYIINGAASSIAELAACVIITPAEVIKQNSQMVQKLDGPAKHTPLKLKDSPTFQTLKTFSKPSQLFRGYSALAARNLPFTAIQFPLYEYMKKTILDSRQHKGKASGSLLEVATATAISAGAAGSLAAVITTPVDVVKTHMMLSASHQAPDIEKQQMAGLTNSIKKVAKKSGGIAVARQVLAESGVRGLFRGAQLRSVWTAFGSGLYLGIYESLRMYLGDRRTASEHASI